MHGGRVSSLELGSCSGSVSEWGCGGESRMSGEMHKVSYRVYH